MLEDYKNIYTKVADSIEDWRNISKNDLINQCVKEIDKNSNLKDAYIAAIMLRYWNSIQSYYSKSFRSVSKEDCYEWLTHAVMYALNHRQWLKESIPEKRKDKKTGKLIATGKSIPNPLFTDKNGPDKVMNICIASTRSIFYQSANTDNKKLNYNLVSTDQLEEDKQDYILPADESLLNSNAWADQMIRDNIKAGLSSENNSLKYYFQAFFVDGIAYNDAFEYNKETKALSFKASKVAKHLRNLDENYCIIFANHFNINQENILKAYHEVKQIKSFKLYKYIEQGFNYLNSNLSKYTECYIN